MPDNLLAQASVDRRAFAVTPFAEAGRADRKGGLVLRHFPAMQRVDGPEREEEIGWQR
jgi:hypothetical protein